MNIYALELARIPKTSLKILLRLCKTILRGKLAKTNPTIEIAAKDLEQYVAIVNEALTARIIGSNPELIASEVDFDLAVDGFWALLFRRLSEPQAYAHPGLAKLRPELAEAADLEGALERAERARKLFARVFGSTMLADLVKSSFVEQAESTAAVLRMIDEEGLREELEDIVGSQLMRTLDVCQVEYEDMVDERLRRRQGMAQDHRELLIQLRWNLVAYVNAVQSLYRPSKPETGEPVLEHLQPILTLRESLARNTSEAALEAELEGFVELELEAASEPE